MIKKAFTFKNGAVGDSALRVITSSDQHAQHVRLTLTYKPLSRPRQAALSNTEGSDYHNFLSARRERHFQSSARSTITPVRSFS
jgi:hypothetical protein